MDGMNIKGRKEGRQEGRKEGRMDEYDTKEGRM
jgi:hypothetical protein